MATNTCLCTYMSCMLPLYLYLYVVFVRCVFRGELCLVVVHLNSLAKAPAGGCQSPKWWQQRSTSLPTTSSPPPPDCQRHNGPRVLSPGLNLLPIISPGLNLPRITSKLASVSKELLWSRSLWNCFRLNSWFYAILFSVFKGFCRFSHPRGETQPFRCFMIFLDDS